MPRQRQRSHPESLLKNKRVAELGHASIFIDPDSMSDTTFKIVFDKELGSYLIECSPLYVSVMEVIEEIESKF
jgi:hypothetical protein